MCIRDRDKTKLITWPESEIKREELIKNFLTYKPDFDSKLGVELDNRSFEWLVEKKFNISIENILIRAIDNWSKYRLVDVPDNVIGAGDKQLMLKNIEGDGYSQGFVSDKSEFKNLRESAQFVLSNVKGVDRFKAESVPKLEKIAKKLMIPNTNYNRQETLDRKKQACLLYTSPSPRDATLSRMPSSA